MVQSSKRDKPHLARYAGTFVPLCFEYFVFDLISISISKYISVISQFLLSLFIINIIRLLHNSNIFH